LAVDRVQRTVVGQEIGPGADSEAMADSEHIERRVERAAFETDRHLVVGDVTLPPTGYQSRFSDSINRGELEFVQLTDVEITSLLDGSVDRRPFVVLAKRHIRLSYPIAE
jgi:hypothetical protein